MSPRPFVLGVDLGTKRGVCKVYLGGGLDAQTIKLDASLGGRTTGVQKAIKRHAGSLCVGVCIEEPFTGHFSSLKALLPMLGAAVIVCEFEGLPYTTAHLAKLKIHATGKGNAKKPDMQAAAKERWSVELKEDEADAAWAAAYALDNDLFI